jgi:hypothetical protein
MASTQSTQTRSTGIGGLGAAQGYGGTINARPQSNVFGALLGLVRPPPSRPYEEAGRMGTAVWGGFVENIEKDRRLAYQNRYRTASDLLANVSIVAAGIRFFMNLAAAPAWSVKPAEDLGKGESSDEAKQLAEFVQDCMDDMNTSWSRIVRRSGMFRFHGFGIHEWIAKRREDGHIGMADVEQRPQHTIERWELADDGTIVGMWQRWPQNGELLFLPRQKVVYLVDDMMTDSPEGLGLFRHLVDPGERLRRYLKLEGMGYERDLRGLPVGRAPLNELRNRVVNGQMTQEDADRAIAGIEKFLQMQVKEEDSSLLLDSAAYPSPNADGYNVSQVMKWSLELLTSGGTGFHDVGAAIDRLTHDMARIIGVESLLLGGQGGGSGSKSLSEDKSRNLYLMVDGCVKDLAEAYRRDFVGAIWTLNALPMALMPKLHTEDVAFKDVESVTMALANMAQAGAIIQPGDPVINDVRDLLGLSKEPDDLAGLAMQRALVPRVNTGGPDGQGGPEGGPQPGGGGGPGGGQHQPDPNYPTHGIGDKPTPHPSTAGDQGAQGAGHVRPPGPSPTPPGAPQNTASREGAPPQRRNRTSSSVIKVQT